MTHICFSELTPIGSDNSLLPGQHQAIIWTNVELLWMRLQGTYFNEISTKIQTFSFNKMHLYVSSAKWQPFYLSLNVLIDCSLKLNKLQLSSFITQSNITQYFAMATKMKQKSHFEVIEDTKYFTTGGLCHGYFGNKCMTLIMGLLCALFWLKHCLATDLWAIVYEFWKNI